MLSLFYVDDFYVLIGNVHGAGQYPQIVENVLVAITATLDAHENQNLYAFPIIIGGDFYTDPTKIMHNYGGAPSRYPTASHRYVYSDVNDMINLVQSDKILNSPDSFLYLNAEPGHIGSYPVMTREAVPYSYKKGCLKESSRIEDYDRCRVGSAPGPTITTAKPNALRHCRSQARKYGKAQLGMWFSDHAMFTATFYL
jgi:hypothetical protein